MSRTMHEAFVPLAYAPFVPGVIVPGRPVSATPSHAGYQVGVSVWLIHDFGDASETAWEVFVHPAQGGNSIPERAEYLDTVHGIITMPDLTTCPMVAHVFVRPVEASDVG